jgi:type 1 fimbria pilin
MTFSTPVNSNGVVAIPTFNQTVSFEIFKSDGSSLPVNQGNSFNETNYVGVRGVTGGDYSVSAQYS